MPKLVELFLFFNFILDLVDIYVILRFLMPFLVHFRRVLEEVVHSHLFELLNIRSLVDDLLRKLSL